MLIKRISILESKQPDDVQIRQNDEQAGSGGHDSDVSDSRMDSAMAWPIEGVSNRWPNHGEPAERAHPRAWLT